MVCLYPTISTQWFSGFWSCPLTFFNKYSFIFLLIICYSHSIGFHISYIIFFFSVLCQLLGIIIRICSKRFLPDKSSINVVERRSVPGGLSIFWLNRGWVIMSWVSNRLRDLDNRSIHHKPSVSPSVPSVLLLRLSYQISNLWVMSAHRGSSVPTILMSLLVTESVSCLFNQ